MKEIQKKLVLWVLWVLLGLILGLIAEDGWAMCVIAIAFLATSLLITIVKDSGARDRIWRELSCAIIVSVVATVTFCLKSL